MIARITLLTCYVWFNFSLLTPIQAQPLPLTSFDSLEHLMRAEAKPVLIFIRTDWCKICALQEQTTFEDSIVIRALASNYYCLQLDAAEKAPISFLGREYGYRPSGVSDGIHELAELLASDQGHLVYPTTTFLSEKFEVEYTHRGLLKTEELKEILEESSP